MIVRKTAGALAVAIAISCAGPSSRPAVPTAPTSLHSASVRVSGRVIDYVTGNTVPGTPLTFSAPFGSQLNFSSVSAIADSGGRFSVELPVKDSFPSGFYRLAFICNAPRFEALP